MALDEAEVWAWQALEALLVAAGAGRVVVRLAGGGAEREPAYPS
jgi:hypothetical protein